VKVEFKESFVRDLRNIRDKRVLERIKQAIQNVEAANRLEEIHRLKKLKGEEKCYRIRMGTYRIGLMLEDDMIVFARALHRREIYRFFP
jgi:mRNA interferase RelE/StbE